jgi:hypothetical protein
MNQLTRKFEAETRQVAMYRKDGADYHTLRYVNWLEALVEKFNSEAQSGPTNTTQDEILLLRITQHLDEIKFGCLHGLKADLKRYSAKHSAMR